jgi:hypothetical protein
LGLECLATMTLVVMFLRFGLEMDVIPFDSRDG